MPCLICRKYVISTVSVCCIFSILNVSHAWARSALRIWLNQDGICNGVIRALSGFYMCSMRDAYKTRLEHCSHITSNYTFADLIWSFMDMHCAYSCYGLNVSLTDCH